MIVVLHRQGSRLLRPERLARLVAELRAVAIAVSRSPATSAVLSW